MTSKELEIELFTLLRDDSQWGIDSSIDTLYRCYDILAKIDSHREVVTVRGANEGVPLTQDEIMQNLKQLQTWIEKNDKSNHLHNWSHFKHTNEYMGCGESSENCIRLR